MQLSCPDKPLDRCRLVLVPGPVIAGQKGHAVIRSLLSIVSGIH